MNALRKKAAVEKFSAEKTAGKDKAQVLDLINADERKYTPEEAQEIVDAIFSDAPPETENKPDEKEPGRKSKEEANEAPYYEEWDVQINRSEKGKLVYEKLKLSREKVKISEDEANTLNHGVLEGGNQYAKMYFLPGKK